MTLAELRTLLAARLPAKPRKPGGSVPTGVPALDDALGGGLPAGQLTELVSAAPSSGGQTVLAQLLHATRGTQQRLALIDGADGFAPEAVPADTLRHLVWVRAGSPEQAMAAADLLVRDGNYAVVVLDLRGLSERALLKQPSSVWHRLHHAAAGAAPAVLVQTTTPLVAAVPWRLVLRAAHPLPRQRTARETLAAALTVEIARGHAHTRELGELAG
jgi:hypothetical protein